MNLGRVTEEEEKSEATMAGEREDLVNLMMEEGHQLD